MNTKLFDTPKINGTSATTDAIDESRSRMLATFHALRQQQVKDYAARKQMDIATVERWLALNLW